MRSEIVPQLLLSGISLLIVFDGLSDGQRQWTGPQIFKFCTHALGHLAFFCGNQLDIPFMVGFDRCAREVGAADDEAALRAVLENIAFGMKALSRCVCF